MSLGLNRILSIKNPILNTPLIPGYSEFGRRRKPSKISEKHIRDMAKKLGVKCSLRGRKKTVKQLWSNVATKMKCVLRIKRPTSPKTRRYQKYLIRHLPVMAMRLKIKGAHRKTKMKLAQAIISKVKTQLKRLPTKRRKRRSRRLPTTRNNFGSWWDNTQKTYSTTCRGRQCGSTYNANGGYPFYRPIESNWKPYYPLKRNSFGYY